MEPQLQKRNMKFGSEYSSINNIPQCILTPTADKMKSESFFFNNQRSQISEIKSVSSQSTYNQGGFSKFISKNKLGENLLN